MRRKYIVNKNMQYRLALYQILYILLFVSSVFLTVFIPLFFEIQEGDVYSEKVLYAANWLLYLHKNFWPVAVTFFVGIFLHSLLISHKIAGPLYRFTRLCETVTNGLLPRPTNLRKGDYLHKEMATINEMFVSLRGKLTDLHQAHELLREDILQLREAASRAAPDDIVEHIQNVTKRERQLGEKLDSLTIES